MTLLMVIIYLVMGFGAFWVLNEEKKHFETKIMKWTEDSVTNDENLNRFFRSITYIPKSVNSFTMEFAIILALVIWAAWPVMFIGCGIWYYASFKRICRN